MSYEVTHTALESQDTLVSRQRDRVSVFSLCSKRGRFKVWALRYFCFKCKWSWEFTNFLTKYLPKRNLSFGPFQLNYEVIHMRLDSSDTLNFDKEDSMVVAGLYGAHKRKKYVRFSPIDIFSKTWPLYHPRFDNMHIWHMYTYTYSPCHSWRQ